MGHHRQSQLTAAGEDPGKLAGRIAELARVEADAMDTGQMRPRLLQGGEGRLFA
ncbi:hypothetical protein D3C77_723500 [compost metagenome]